MKRTLISVLMAATGSVILLTLLGAIGLAGCYVYLEPSLPSVEAMRNVEMQVPLRVYTRDGDLIAQIGEQRRIPVTWEQIPDLVKHAFLAAEDDRFFQHHGIDYQGVLRAVLVDIISGDRAQGASTITQQAARQLYLTLDKTWRRKLAEAFLTYRMEHEFTKQEIFALYLNVVFFGERAYGVAAAAETFYGKPLEQLTVAQAATLAGIVQLPSRYNPIVNPQFAKVRRTYVLRRMKDLGFIDAEVAAAANAEPVEARTHAPLYDVDAQYVAEMARQEVRKRFGPKAETAGYRVYTTIDGRLQTAANRAVRLGLIEYDRRYGWRGANAHVEVAAGADASDLEDQLEEYSPVGPLIPAVVTEVAEQSAKVYAKDLGFQQINWDGLAWARRQLDYERTGPAPKSAGDVLARGDVIYIYTDGQHAAQLVQVPEAQAALVSIDPTDGGVAALVGGFDYFSNKYNRAVQAKRQPGSSFKPFLYSSALENGFTAASVLPDAPIVIEGSGMETAWRPKNSHGGFNGPTRLREALAKSLNLVSIRLLRQIGVDYAIDYATRFGFQKDSLPNNYTLALGTMQVAPIDLAGAYATFANGGFRVSPYFIDRIEDVSGKILWSADAPIACLSCEHSADLTAVPLKDASDATLAAADAVRGGAGPLTPRQLAPRVISPQNDYIITDMMADVIRHGTGSRALVLGRSDLAGKTGTTDESKDAWFNGFNTRIVTTVWVGFDQERSLGESEEGARTALPIWIGYMREALKNLPEEKLPMPDGLVQLRVSAQTGALVSAENPDGMLETFMVNHLPGSAAPSQTQPTGNQTPVGGDSLF
ncbi:MAG TPA: penicillin-binding protein 1A [Steroidobacteraceae bacterium]|nr:penicillin-binding protein 1A [Steroidobacteraceae bacterium]